LISGNPTIIEALYASDNISKSLDVWDNVRIFKKFILFYFLLFYFILFLPRSPPVPFLSFFLFFIASMYMYSISFSYILPFNSRIRPLAPLPLSYFKF